MIAVDSGLLALLAGLALIALVVVRITREEHRRDEAWLDYMRTIGRRCPACEPWGGWYLGAMKPDGGYEVHTCVLCNGTGEQP